MAFGFIKKVFSFGRKEDEQRPAEPAPLPPIDLDELDALTQDGQPDRLAPTMTIQIQETGAPQQHPRFGGLHFGQRQPDPWTRKAKSQLRADDAAGFSDPRGGDLPG